MRKFGLLVAALLASAGNSAYAASTLPASDYTFNWSGDCWDCAGTATATLKLSNYVLGSQITAANFVSFTYGGTNLFSAYSFNQINSITGSISDTAGSYFVNLSGSTPSPAYFRTDVAGFWSTGVTPAADFGNGGVWTLSAAVPEADSWALLILGFGGVGAAMRRRKVSLSYA